MDLGQLHRRALDSKPTQEYIEQRRLLGFARAFLNTTYARNCCEEAGYADQYEIYIEYANYVQFVDVVSGKQTRHITMKEEVKPLVENLGILFNPLRDETFKFQSMVKELRSLAKELNIESIEYVYDKKDYVRSSGFKVTFFKKYNTRQSQK